MSDHNCSVCTTSAFGPSEQFCAESQEAGLYTYCMAIGSTLLCIHRDPAQLTLLRENGYELVMATNGSDGLRLLMSRPVDAIVIEYHLGLDSAVIAAEIKKVKPQLPIVMQADDLELPEGALNSVDALVTKSDGPHFLWATVHFVVNVKPTQRSERCARKRRHISAAPAGPGTAERTAD
jgi:CheY-like chemotaxis protein